MSQRYSGRRQGGGGILPTDSGKKVEVEPGVINIFIHYRIRFLSVAQMPAAAAALHITISRS